MRERGDTLFRIAMVKEKERMERGDKKQNFNGDDEDDVFL